MRATPTMAGSISLAAMAVAAGVPPHIVTANRPAQIGKMRLCRSIQQPGHRRVELL